MGIKTDITEMRIMNLVYANNIQRLYNNLQLFQINKNIRNNEGYFYYKFII